MELGRRRYALRVARSALRRTAPLRVMIVVRLVSPAFRHRVATWQYITGLIGGTLAVSLLIGVLTAVTLSRVFSAIIGASARSSAARLSCQPTAVS